MQTIDGIKTEKILKLVITIGESWDDYFFKFSFCQKKISYEPAYHYMRDLVAYFRDATELLKSMRIHDNYLDSLHETVAALQFMYIQQDLIDELCLVFKIAQSKSDEKAHIRSLRNQLTGHPISRDKNHVRSSVFFTDFSHGTRLQYLIYKSENNFDGETITENWSDIFRTHEKYLIDNLQRLLDKIYSILKEFKKGLLKMIGPSLSLEKLVNWVNIIYSDYNDRSYLTKEKTILYCNAKRFEHARYEHAVHIYRSSLPECVKETIEDLNTFLSDNPTLILPQHEFINTFDVVEHRDEIATQKMFAYYFSKLSEKRDLLGLPYFISRFNGDDEVYDELKNMSDNKDNDAEYFSSYYYLQKIFTNRGLLKDR